MENDLFCGERVYLCREDPEIMATAFQRWNQDSEYSRLLDSYPSQQWSTKARTRWLENDLGEERDDVFIFMIRARADDCLIGAIGLEGVRWNHGDSFVGIGIGEREFWGQGYGSDAMRIVLRYAFTELNLQRVSLDVFDYNPRAIRSYEKVGFRHEGRIRQALSRDGRRYDLVYMGILRQEWQQANG